MEFMFRMKKQLWVTGKMLVMGSGFCVLKVLIGVFDRELHGSELVGNCRY